MTIIVGITTPDGVILASDSRLTRSFGESHRIVSDSAQKPERATPKPSTSNTLAWIESPAPLYAHDPNACC